jgi:hypothetical protein
MNFQLKEFFIDVTFELKYLMTRLFEYCGYHINGIAEIFLRLHHVGCLRLLYDGFGEDDHVVVDLGHT